VSLRQSNGTASGVLRSAHRRGIRRSSGEASASFARGPVPCGGTRLQYRRI